MKPPRESLDLYYREAGSWAEDRRAGLHRSRRIAWIVAAAACVVALVEAFALFALVPLKTVQPYTLLVDRHTGYVEALKPLDADRIAPDAALTRSFLVQYVIARESFDIVTLQDDYRKVALWSAGAARSDYVAGMQAGNPNSPLATLPRAAIVDTEVKSVSPLGTGAALVRFETVRRDAGAAVPPRAWVAIVRYRFADQPLSQSERFINPLGFQVTRYRRDQEAIPAAVDQGAPPGRPAVAPTLSLTPRASAVPVQTTIYPVEPGVPTTPRAVP